MSSDLAELETAWRAVFGDGATSRSAGDELIARYRQPHRVYHGCRHLVWVVRHARQLASAPGVDTADVDALLAAAFYHDAVYEPRASDNEARSGDLASAELLALGWPRQRASRVAALVACTATHEPTDHDIDAAVLCDADLAVLGTDPADYQAYVTGVRREYSHVDEGAWRTGRARVMATYAARHPIYRTAMARERWEARAHANIAAELAAIG